MIKFSTPGSPFQNIWMVYDDFSEETVNSGYRGVDVDITCPDKRKNVGNVLHKNPTFELQSDLSIQADRSLVIPQHLASLLVGIDFFAAKKDALEKVYDVLFT